MIWEPFILALVLGIIVSAGLYFAYLWPSAEPPDDAPDEVEPAGSPTPVTEAADSTVPADPTDPTVPIDVATSPAP